MRLLITAGPTREFFDSVRFISNPSTGKMGFALAAAAGERGHDVTLVSGPVALQPPPGIRTVGVTTADEMLRASRRAFSRCDAAIFTAAVADYRPVRRLARKRAKKLERWTVELEPTPDIAATLGAVKGRRLCVGFAMEDHHGRAHAEAKLRRKCFDLIVLNGIRNVAADDARVEVLCPPNGWQRWALDSKAGVATRLIGLLERRIMRTGA